jgi:hypothetical protein
MCLARINKIMDKEPALTWILGKKSSNFELQPSDVLLCFVLLFEDDLQ